MHLTTEQKVKITVRPITPGGNPARIDGPVRFVSGDESVVVIDPIDDTTAWARAISEGTATVTATFDADLDEGEVRFLSFDAEITVIAAEAESGSVDFGDVEYLVLTPQGQSEAHESNAAPADPEVPVAETVEDVVAETPVEEAPAGDVTEDAPAETSVTEEAPAVDTEAAPAADGEDNAGN